MRRARRVGIARRSRGQRGATLAVVLILMTVGLILLVAALAFASVGFRSGSAYDAVGEDRVERGARLPGADHPAGPGRGWPSDTRTATVAGVTARAPVRAGSGRVVGNGRTDRVIGRPPSITARYRIFDRSGDQPGIIVETLSTSTE